MGVLETLGSIAFPEAAKLIQGVKEKGLGKEILSRAFPKAYALGERFRKTKSNKDKPTATSEVTAAVDQLTENTVMTNEILSQSVALQNAQNEVLRDILGALQDLKNNQNPIDLPDFDYDRNQKNKKQSPKKPPKARKGYRYNEKTGRYHDEKTGKMASQEKATGVKPAEKVSGPKAAEGPAAGTSSTGVKVVKTVGWLMAADLAWTAYKELSAISSDDPDYFEKATRIVTSLAAHIGLGMAAGALMAAILAPTGPGAIVGFLAGLAAGTVAEYFLGDTVEEVTQKLLDKLFEKKGKKPTTGASLVSGEGQTIGANVLEDHGAKTEGSSTAIMKDTLSFNASEQIKFIAATMELKANEVILLGGVQSLDDIASSGGPSPQRIGGAPGQEQQGSSQAAGDTKGVGDTSQPTDRGSIDYSGITSKLDLVSITSKTGPSAKVNKPYAAAFQGLVNDLESRDYKIKSMGGQAVRGNANNPSVLSYHSFGAAIDINPATNANGSRQSDMPDGTNAIAAKWGLGWGRNFRSTPDPMHFSVAQSEGGSVPLDRQGNIKGYASGSPSVPKSGPAIVGEKGREKVKRDGKTYVTPGRATAVNLKKGDRVEPHEDNGALDIGLSLARTAIGFVPIAGQVAAGAETAYHAYNGDYKKAAKSAIGAIPGGGIVGAVGGMAANYAIDQLVPEKSAPRTPPPPPAKPKKSASGAGSGGAPYSSDKTSNTGPPGSKKNNSKNDTPAPQAQNSSGSLLGMFHPGN
jgi:hypothetical protein